MNTLNKTGERQRKHWVLESVEIHTWARMEEPILSLSQLETLGQIFDKHQPNSETGNNSTPAKVSLALIAIRRVNTICNEPPELQFIYQS